MKTSMLWVVYAMIASSCGAFAEDSIPSYELDSLKVEDYVGDILVEPDVIRSLFDDILTHEYLLKYKGSKSQSPEFATLGYDRIVNVFSMPHDGGERRSHIDIELAIESVYYGPKQENMKGMLITTWLIGPLLASFTASDSDVVIGYIQLRATLRTPGHPDGYAVIGYGATAGQIDTMSRYEALRLAKFYAIWDISYSIVERIGEMARLDLKKGNVPVIWEEYHKIVEAWIEGVE